MKEGLPEFLILLAIIGGWLAINELSKMQKGERSFWDRFRKGD